MQRPFGTGTLGKGNPRTGSPAASAPMGRRRFAKGGMTEMPMMEGAEAPPKKPAKGKKPAAKKPAGGNPFAKKAAMPMMSKGGKAKGC